MGQEQSDLTIEAGGHRLRARWLAPRTSPSQPVIVLLHQGLGSVTQWRDFPQLLAAATGAAVLSYDRYGYGRSDAVSGERPPTFLAEEAERTLPEVLDYLSIERPIVYGHSDGGTIALLFAAAFPDRPAAIVSEDAHVFAEAHLSKGYADMLAAFDQGDLKRKLARHHDDVVGMFRSWTGAWLSPAMRDWNITARLPLIRCPALVMQGENDDHCLPEQFTLIADGIGGEVERWLVPKCGHSPHLETTADVIARTATFLKRVGAI